MQLYFKLNHENSKAPTKAYEGDAGWDLTTVDDVTVEPGEFLDVNSGIELALPSDTWARITGRSSTWRGWKLLVIEGIIDTGYRGELCIGLFNPGKNPVHIPTGTRIAQLLLHQHVPVQWIGQTNLPPSKRGTQGFGSSGL